jgi:nitric oxide reductase NorE protein
MPTSSSVAASATADPATVELRLPGTSDRPAVTGEQESAGVVLGQPDMWAFVLFECLVFASYFIIYMLYRMHSPEIFLRSQEHLNQNFGVANTLVLLTSSWLIARCVQSAREKKYDAALRQVLLTLLCGMVFVTSKTIEWSMKVREGFEFSTNEFFSFYYFLTGMHVVHVLIGFVVLGVVIYQLWSPERRSQEIVETGATYWHMVDFLWVLIFALLYVMR